MSEQGGAPTPGALDEGWAVSGCGGVLGRAGGVRVVFLSRRQQQGACDRGARCVGHRDVPFSKTLGQKEVFRDGFWENLSPALASSLLGQNQHVTSMENPSKSWCHRSLPWALSLARAWLRVTRAPFCPPRPLPALDPHLELLEEEQVLRIPSSQPQHQGTYQCLATNPAGQHSKIFQLHVHSESPAALHPIPFQSP